MGCIIIPNIYFWIRLLLSGRGGDDRAMPGHQHQHQHGDGVQRSMARRSAVRDLLACLPYRRIFDVMTEREGGRAVAARLQPADVSVWQILRGGQWDGGVAKRVLGD